jgi:hypothetical protein
VGKAKAKQIAIHMTHQLLLACLPHNRRSSRCASSECEGLSLTSNSHNSIWFSIKASVTNCIYLSVKSILKPSEWCLSQSLLQYRILSSSVDFGAVLHKSLFVQLPSNLSCSRKQKNSQLNHRSNVNLPS